MIDEKDFLVEGERRLGRYTTVIMQQTQHGSWTPSVMQLDSLVSNYRLFLRPFRRKYVPATIPAHYVHRVLMTKLERYRVVALELLTSHYLYMMTSTGRLEDFYDDLRAMKAPPPRVRFDERVARADIVRLITFFGQQPHPDQPDES
ncbi:MAG: hypothetical protein NZ750_02960 [Anaerolineae bacterium]|nr:hypothetical protein [Anaerolineae bacterium]MDW8173360.1 hypothetical protein [Anaerolineae bacterium]